MSITLGDASLSLDLRHWVNEGLMAFFFFVVGLEARREFDMGELRERRRIALPVLAGIGGMAVPVLIYLAINVRRPGAHGWGAAMSTDTAFALGMLALVGPRSTDRLRVFMLTVFVVDDVVALLVIAIAYTDHVAAAALAIAIGIFALVLVLRALGVSQGLVYLALGIAAWIALFESGIQPEIIGLAMGLVTGAYAATRVDLERATELVPARSASSRPGACALRPPRRRPADLAERARAGAAASVDELRRRPDLRARECRPRRSTRTCSAAAIRSPITIGIFVAYVVGKPVGIVATSWLARARA